MLHFPLFAINFHDARLCFAQRGICGGECDGAFFEVENCAVEIVLRGGELFVCAGKCEFQLVDFTCESGEAGLCGFALLERGGHLCAQAADFALQTRGVVVQCADACIRFLTLRGESSGARLHFFHAAEFAGEKFGDLDEFAVRVAQLCFCVLEFLLRTGDVRAVTLLEGFKFGGALGVERKTAFVIGDALPQVLHGLPCRSETRFHFIHRRTLGVGLFLFGGDLHFEFVLAHGERFEFLGIRGARAFQFVPLALRVVSLQRAEILQHSLIALRFRRLPLHAADLALHFFDDVGKTQQVRLGRLQFAECFLALEFVFRNPRRFLENRAPVFGTARQNLIDLALLHDRVGRAPDARVHEQRMDVLQTARRAIQQILAAALAEHTARDFHLVPVQPELLLALAERHRDFRHAQRGPRVRAGENYVRHFAAAQRLGRLLAEHPADAVEDVGFAAAIWPDDASHAAVEIECGLWCE